MGRAQQTQVQNTGNTMTAAENATAGTAGNAALTGYQGMYANPGYSTADKSAITNSTLGGVGAAVGTAGQKLANQAARTRNTAGLNASEDVLSQNAMRTNATAAAENETNFANEAIRQKQVALQGEQGIYGTATGGANQTLGTLQKNAEMPGFWDQFGSSFAKGLGGGTAGLLV